MQVNPLQKPAKSPARIRGRLATVALLVGLVVAWGSDRQPADATKPVVWYRSVTASRAPPSTDLLRIVSYNIHGGKGRDHQLDLRRIAADLTEIDVAGLYEVRSSPFRMPADQAAQLSDVTGLNSLFLPTEHRWWHDHFGNALLSKSTIAAVHRIPLPGTRGKAFRQAVLFDVPLGGETVHVLMSHVDSQQDREPQLRAVIHLFHSLKSPAILMGDLNSGPRDPQMVKLLSQPGVASVLDSDTQDHIDWIITRGLECIAAECVASGASDHPVVRATLRLP